MEVREKTEIMTKDDIRRSLVRISHEIVERNKGTDITFDINGKNYS